MKKHILLLSVIVSMAATAWGQMVVYGDSCYMFHHMDTFPPLLSEPPVPGCNPAWDCNDEYAISRQDGSIYVSDSAEHIYGIALTSDTALYTRRGRERDETLSLMLYLYQVPSGSSEYILLDSTVFSVTMPYSRKFVYMGIDIYCPDEPLRVDTVAVYERLFSREYVIPAGDSVLVTYRRLHRLPGMIPYNPILLTYNQNIWDYTPEMRYHHIVDGVLTCDYCGRPGPIYPIRQRSCPKLSGLRVDTVDGTTVCLSWHPEGEARHYRVEYGPAGFQYGGGVYSEGVVVDSIGDTTICLSGLQEEKVYAFYVSAYCEDKMQYSMPESVRAMTNHNASCARPGSFRKVGQTDVSATFRWDTLSEQREFQMLVKQADDTAELYLTPTSNPYELTGLAPGSSYSVWLRARCHHECEVHDTLLWSPWSNPVRFHLSNEGVGVADGNLRFSLTPNPARGSVVVTVPDPRDVGGGSTLTLSDASGRRLLTLPVTDPQLTLSLAPYPAGPYFLTLTTPQGSSTQKLVVE